MWRDLCRDSIPGNTRPMAKSQNPGLVRQAVDLEHLR